MPFYAALREVPSKGDRTRTLDGLLALRREFAAQKVPARSLDDTLLLATWNIREFDAGEKFGKRCDEAFYYIAEILSHFDLIAVQEVCEDLAPLDRVMRILGGWWKYIVTDVTYGASGNGERMAFVYDSRKVTFGGLAGEVVLPAPKNKPSVQLARTPFICGFKAGWSKFNICTVHIYYGTSKPEDPRRVAEIQKLSKLLAKYVAGPPPKQPDTKRGQSENLIILGDFNIFSKQDETFKALTRAGFTIPPELMKRKGSNLDQSKFYDQIAFITRTRRFETTGRAGVFDFSRAVFGADGASVYERVMKGCVPDKFAAVNTDKERAALYSQWRTFQMSDHLLLWSELKIDFSKEYLEDVRNGDGAVSNDDDS